MAGFDVYMGLMMSFGMGGIRNGIGSGIWGTWARSTEYSNWKFDKLKTK